jgi:hypothetical protein
MYRTGILLGLKQARNHGRLKGADWGGLSLQADVGRVRKIVGLPPPLTLSLARERHHPVAFGFVGYFVEVAEVADVAGGSDAVAGFHAADLARRAEETVGYLLDGEAFFVAECP